MSFAAFLRNFPLNELTSCAVLVATVPIVLPVAESKGQGLESCDRINAPSVYWHTRLATFSNSSMLVDILLSNFTIL